MTTKPQHNLFEAKKTYRQFDLIVFDWDGTLYDSTAAISHAIQASVVDLGYNKPSDEKASYVIGLGLKQALAYAAPDVPPERFAELGLRYRYHFSKALDELNLFEGVLPMLNALKATGALLAVATGKSRSGLNEVLQTMDLRGVFDDSRTADETNGKPDPLMLHELMDSLQVTPDRVLMVGDTSHDLGMANNAGCHSLGVSYGAHDQANLDACHPMAVVHSVGEMHQWLLARLQP
jgi:phosphoglycolate phosphatase